MVHAIVALLPEPVMPSSVWNRSPRLTPSASLAMACGWSPAGWKSETTLKSDTVLILEFRTLVRYLVFAVGRLPSSDARCCAARRLGRTLDRRCRAQPADRS